MPGANTRITETGAVNWPTLRQTPQVRVSSFSFSTSAMFHPRRLAPLKNHNHCWRRAPVSILVLFPSKQPGRQATPRKPACRLDVWVVPWHSRDEKKGRRADDESTSKTRVARTRRRRRESASGGGGRGRRRLLRAARRLQRSRPRRQLRRRGPPAHLRFFARAGREGVRHVQHFGVRSRAA